MSVTTMNRPNGNGDVMSVSTTDTAIVESLKPKRKSVDAITFMRAYMSAYEKGLDPVTKKCSATLEQVASELGLSPETAYQKMNTIRKKLFKEKGISIPILATKKKQPRKRVARLDIDELAAIAAGKHLAELD